ncbi:hypothetical protein K439DRAFT_1270680, partial [Ramaria rubella]
FWASPLLGDTVIFVLTLMKTRQYSIMIRELTRTSMLRLLLRDGTLYYASVCIIHMVNLFLILMAPPDLKPIGGRHVPFTTLLVCRIVLNLRKQSSQPFHPS